jgi:hypothetical protein
MLFLELFFYFYTIYCYCLNLSHLNNNNKINCKDPNKNFKIRPLAFALTLLQRPLAVGQRGLTQAKVSLFDRSEETYPYGVSKVVAAVPLW